MATYSVFISYVEKRLIDQGQRNFAFEMLSDCVLGLADSETTFMNDNAIISDSFEWDDEYLKVQGWTFDGFYPIDNWKINIPNSNKIIILSIDYFGIRYNGDVCCFSVYIGES